MALAKPKPAFTSARRLATKCACFSDSASSLNAAKARSKGRPLPTKLANCRVQGLDPEDYLVEVLKRLPHDATPDQAAPLTPARIAAERRAAADQAA